MARVSDLREAYLVARREWQHVISGEWRELNRARRIGIEPDQFFDFGSGADFAFEFHPIKGGLHNAANFVRRRRAERTKKHRAAGPDRASEFLAYFAFKCGQVRFGMSQLSAWLHDRARALFTNQ